MAFYTHWITFKDSSATASESIAYLNKPCYVAYTEGTEEQWAVVYSAEEVEKLDWLDDTEKSIIKKGFDNGLKSLYIRGAINEEWGTGDILPLESFLLDGVETPVHSLAYTLIISPRWKAQKMPSGFKGVLVNTISDIPTSTPSERIVQVYDPMTNNDKKTMDGKALGIMAKFLSQSVFTNMQFQVFTGYNGIPDTGLIDTLKDMKATFLATDPNGNNILGMFSAGGEAIVKPYVSELWRYNIRESLRKWIQIKKPTYIDANLLVIADYIDKVSQQFLQLGYFSEYNNAVVPPKAEQLATDIDNFLVNNVSVQFNVAKGLWNIDITVQEDVI